MDRVPFRATVGASSYQDLHLPVTILLDNIRSMYNVGSFFRTGDGAAIERLILAGITARPPHKGIAKTALGAEERVRWRGTEDSLEEMERILREGGGADRMRAARAAGGMSEVLAQLATEAAASYDSTQTTSPIRTQS